MRLKLKKKEKAAVSYLHTVRPAALKLRKLYASSKNISRKFQAEDASSPENYAENIIEATLKETSVKTVRKVKTDSVKLLRKDENNIKAFSEEKGKKSVEDPHRAYINTGSQRSTPAVCISRSAAKCSTLKNHGSFICRTDSPGSSSKKYASSKKDSEKYIKRRSRCESAVSKRSAYCSSESTVFSPSDDRHKIFRVRSVLKSRRTSSKRILHSSEDVKRAAVKTLPYAGIFMGFFLLVIICVSFLSSIFVSPYAVLYTGTSDFDLKDKIYLLNEDMDAKIDEMISESSADKSVVNGSRASWQEMLPIFAAGYIYSPSCRDMDPSSFLEQIFYDMNSIVCDETSYFENQSIAVTDRDGNVKYEETDVEKSLFSVTVSHLCADDIAHMYSFSDSQMDILHELQSDKYLRMWTDIIYTSGLENDLVSVAASQVGTVGGEPYWSWYGYEERVPWCAIFVSWCAYICGYLDSGSCPMFENCQCGIDAFKGMNAFEEKDHAPERGDIIFFDWEKDGISDHVGIVESVADNVIYTIEGNAGDVCCKKQYSADSDMIAGYGIIEKQLS